MKPARQKLKPPAPPVQPAALPGLPDRRYAWLAAMALAVVAFVSYLPSLDSGLLNWDDGEYVVDEYHVKTGLNLENIQWAFTNFEHGNWHPLTWLSHAADTSLWGLKDVGAYHRTNMFLHALNAALLLLALHRLTRRLWPSAIVAALFALHPLHVESVAWVAERKDLLAALFMFLTLWAYVAYAERPSWRRYLLVVLAFAAALMSKPMAVTWPLVLLLFDYWPLQRLSWRSVYEKLPLLAMTAVSCGFTYYAQVTGGSVWSTESLDFGRRVANAVYGYSMYLVKAFWPYPGTLVPFYPLYGPGRGGAEITVGLLAALVTLLGGVTVLAVLLRRKCPYLFVGWLIYLGMLVPVIGLVQVGKQVMADRYTYVPLVGIFMAVVWLSVAGIQRWPRAAKGAVAVGTLGLCAVLGVLAWQQQAVWKDSVVFWSYVTAPGRYPDCASALNNLAHAHSELGGPANVQKAVGIYEHVLQIAPHEYEACTNLAGILVSQGHIAEAEKLCLRAVAVKEDYAPAYNVYGIALLYQAMQAGNRDQADAARLLDKALPIFVRARELSPHQCDIRLNIAAVQLLKKDYPAAETTCRYIVVHWPEVGKGWEFLALALEGQGRAAEAAPYRQKAAERNSGTMIDIPLPQ